MLRVLVVVVVYIEAEKGLGKLEVAIMTRKESPSSI
jgi:hypothetical protein